jgi:hypothetical protein
MFTRRATHTTLAQLISSDIFNKLFRPDPC